MNRSTVKTIHVEQKSFEAIKNIIEDTFALFIRPCATDTAFVMEIEGIQDKDIERIESVFKADDMTSPLLIEGWETDAFVKVVAA